MKLPILPCTEKLELVLSTAPVLSKVGCTLNKNKRYQQQQQQQQ